MLANQHVFLWKATSPKPVCTALMGQECPNVDCCRWDILELAVYVRGEKISAHDTVKIGPLHQSIHSMYEHYNDHVINGCIVKLQRITRLVKMIWIYCPHELHGDLRSFVSSLTELVRSKECKSHHARTVVEELDNLVAKNNVLPLKTLTRQCIITHIQFKDVKYLPLPTAMKVYVRLGDISPEHPVNNMSLHQLAHL